MQLFKNNCFMWVQTQLQFSKIRLTLTLHSLRGLPLTLTRMIAGPTESGYNKSSKFTSWKVLETATWTYKLLSAIPWEQETAPLVWVLCPQYHNVECLPPSEAPQCEEGKQIFQDTVAFAGLLLAQAALTALHQVFLGLNRSVMEKECGSL